MNSKVVKKAERPKPPNAGKGRPKGVPNKVTAELKDMIRQALDKAGGVDYLTRQADENPAAFMSLVGKTLPKEVTGKDGGPIEGSVTVKVSWHDAK